MLAESDAVGDLNTLFFWILYFGNGRNQPWLERTYLTLSRLLRKVLLLKEFLQEPQLLDPQEILHVF